MNCNRCDFRSDDLTEHAFDSGHLLCIVCQRRSLTIHETQTCPTCIGRVRADLADILDGYAILEPTSLAAVTLLGDGTMQRLMRPDELASLTVTQHPLARADEAWPKPIRDEWPSDPLPVVAALASWEDFWREHYRDPAGPKATLAGVIGYLTANLDTGRCAAQTHPAFDEFAADVHRLRTAVQHAAGLADVPVAAPASCFDCGGELLRTFAPPRLPLASRRAKARKQAAHVLTLVARQRHAEASYGVVQVTDWPVGTARRAARVALRGRPDEGLTDTWTCEQCRRVYDQTEYFIGLQVAGEKWVEVPLVAEVTRRSVRTVRSWYMRGLVTAVCLLDGSERVLVWWPDVAARLRHADDAASSQGA